MTVKIEVKEKTIYSLITGEMDLKKHLEAAGFEVDDSVIEHALKKLEVVEIPVYKDSDYSKHIGAAKVRDMKGTKASFTIRVLGDQGQDVEIAKEIKALPHYDIIPSISFGFKTRDFVLKGKKVKIEGGLEFQNLSIIKKLKEVKE